MAKFNALCLNFSFLELSVLMQAAATFQRLGSSRRARMLWKKCLSIDRLCLPALKNIAICDTLVSADHGQTLLSWKSYCEVLYSHAIAADDPRVSAQAGRSSIGISRRPSRTDLSGMTRTRRRTLRAGAERLIDLLNSPGMLREFVTHKQAEFLNRWFEIRTSVLLLGCDRSLEKNKAAEGGKKKERDG